MSDRCFTLTFWRCKVWLDLWVNRNRGTPPRWCFRIQGHYDSRTKEGT